MDGLVPIQLMTIGRTMASLLRCVSRPGAYITYSERFAFERVIVRAVRIRQCLGVIIGSSRT